MTTPRVIEVTDERTPLAERALELIQSAIWDVHPARYLLAELRETRQGTAQGGGYHLLVTVEPEDEATPIAAATGAYLAAVNAGFVSYLAVREDQRGRGLGKALRSHLVEALRAPRTSRRRPEACNRVTPGGSGRRYKEAAFLLHQATERLYHCVLLVLTAYKPKVHNLEDLGKRAGDLHPGLRSIFPRGTPEEDRLFKLLKRAYVDARYGPNFAITSEELAAIAVHVRELRSRVEMVCRERIDAMATAMPG